MARRRKKSRRRANRGINVLTALESIALLDIASEGFFGGNILEVVTGAGDIGYKGSGTSMVLSNPGGIVSLRDIISNPGPSVDAISANFAANWLDVAFKSATISIGFKLGKKLLAPTRRRANMLLKEVGLRSVAHF